MNGINMGRLKMYFLAIVIIVVTTVSFVVFASDSDSMKSVELLESYGWSVDKKPVDEAEVIIPNPFDLVYENYNAIQLDAGLDLKPYMGMSGRRYTYTVKNYPDNVGEMVYANVICIEGEAVAGDIMTVSLSGFMHSLKYPVNKQGL